MKLSKQERIGILVVALLLIIGLGVWMFIIPKIDTVNKSNTTLATKEQELKDAQAKALNKDPLKDQIIAAYEEGENLADMFFEEMTSYEADMEFRAFLEQCDANVMVESLTVGEPTTITMAPSYFEKEEVTYDLKTYVTQDVEKTEKEIETEERWNEIRNALGVSQTVGAITVEFTVNATDPKELLNFADEVNEYIKVENEKQTRKAVVLNGYEISYPLNEKKYDELIDEKEEEAAEEAYDLIREKYDLHPELQPEQTAPEVEEKDTVPSAKEYIFELSTSVTFYSVERMQDPADQLKAQEQ